VTVEMRSPLARRTDDLPLIDAVEVAFLAQVDVRCGAVDAARLGFPTEPNIVGGDLTRGALWLGPDEWLVVGLPGTAAATIDEFEAALSDSHHAVVDVSANRAVIELRGVDRLELLASGCSLDLDPLGGWVPGVCAQTLFARTQVILQEMEGATRLFVRPSFAHYVVDRLLVSAGA
jgi:sarcosine oxidase subunit gamma